MFSHPLLAVGNNPHGANQIFIDDEDDEDDHDDDDDDDDDDDNHTITQPMIINTHSQNSTLAIFKNHTATQKKKKNTILHLSIISSLR